MLRLLNEHDQPLPVGFHISMDHAGDWWLHGAEGESYPLGRWADPTEAARDAWRELHIRKLLKTPERLRLDAACAALEAARSELNEAARAYAHAETLTYAKAHPRRKVVFCAAMGSTSLDVQPGGCFAYRGEYSLKAYGADIGQPPAFLNVLSDIESEFDIRYALGGDLLLECRGAEVLRDLAHW